MTKDLSRNKVPRLQAVILFANKAKNAVIALATASIFNAVGEQMNKQKWAGYFWTDPKYQNYTWQVGIIGRSTPIRTGGIHPSGGVSTFDGTEREIKGCQQKWRVMGHFPGAISKPSLNPFLRIYCPKDRGNYLG